MNMYIVIVFNLKWQGVWPAYLEERSPCARHRNKESLLHSPLTTESATPAFQGISGNSRLWFLSL